MFLRYLLLCACLFLFACASSNGVGEGIREEAGELGHEIASGARATGRVAEGVGEDVVAWAKGEDTTDLHELSGSNTVQNQQEHERQMAALCNTSEANIHKLRKQGLTWNAIAARYGLNNDPAGQPVWQSWTNVPGEW